MYQKLSSVFRATLILGFLALVGCGGAGSPLGGGGSSNSGGSNTGGTGNGGSGGTGSGSGSNGGTSEGDISGSGSTAGSGSDNTDDGSNDPIIGFSRPLVTLTFDDGPSSFYQNALPLLQKYGLNCTAFIISGAMDHWSDYMTSAQVAQVYNLGNEIGSHSVTHTDLTTLSLSATDAELANSQSALQNLIHVSIPSFATPYGASSKQVMKEAAKYYRAVRSAEMGLNGKNNFNAYNILVEKVKSNTPVSKVKTWIDRAKAKNAWLVLIYYKVDPTLTNRDAEPYNVFPSDLDAQLAYLKASGVTVKTFDQALDEILPQVP